MKKIFIAIIILISSIASAEHQVVQTGQIKFKIQNNHSYEFSVNLKAKTKYIFRLQGKTTTFNFQLVDPFGNEFDPEFSYFSERITAIKRTRNEGQYTIRIYSMYNNMMTLTWREYEE